MPLAEVAAGDPSGNAVAVVLSIALLPPPRSWSNDLHSIGLVTGCVFHFQQTGKGWLN
jgi:hypothetical protein